MATTITIKAIKALYSGSLEQFFAVCKYQKTEVGMLPNSKKSQERNTPSKFTRGNSRNQRDNDVFINDFSFKR